MPPPSSKSLTRGNWRAVALSILLHLALVAAAVYGWFTWKHKPPPSEILAIEANVVDERALKGIAEPPKPAPPPAKEEPQPAPIPEPIEETGPPKPDPVIEERKKEEERLAEQKVAEDKLAQEKAEQEKAEQLKADEEARELQEREKESVAKAAAEKAAQKKAAQEALEKAEQAAAKAAADKKALEKKRADDAAAAKQAADEKARLAREAELRRSLEAEERGNAVRNSDLASRWHAQIVARITRAWIRPPSARAGVACIVSVTQVPGGEVTAVRVDSCTGGDAALRESVEAAVYRASPLPSPPDPALFERNLELTFAPNE